MPCAFATVDGKAATSAEQLRSRNDSPVPAMLNVQRVPVGAVTKHPGVNNVFKMTMP